ncbi:MAG: hypothetical protein P4L46_05285 [Fimbriimonas sp.]|nr:hypothetical protein [Fimbriimonas sp.]
MGQSSLGRNNKSIVWLTIAVAVVISLFALWSKSPFGQAPTKLEAELKAAASDGMPTGPDDLRRLSAVPSGQNAAPSLVIAFANLKTWSDSKEGKAFSKDLKAFRSGDPVDDGLMARIRKDVGSASKLLGLLSQADAFPRVDFRREWEKGPSLLLPQFASEKLACSLLLARARIQMADGDLEGGLQSMHAAAHLADLAGQEPMIIGYLVRSAMVHLVLRDLAAVIDSHPNDLGVLERCRTVALALGPSPDVRPAIGAELVSGRIAMNMIAKNPSAQLFGDNEPKMLMAARFGPTRTIFEWRYVQVMHELYRALGRRPESFLAMHKAFVDVDNKLSSNADWTYAFAELMSPVFTNMSSALGECQAMVNVTLCGIDLLEVRAKTGSFPLKLPGQVGQWTDPLTEKPMIYRPSAKGFLIYSVGPNGVDDGGKPRTVDSRDQEYDVPFQFPAAAVPSRPAKSKH